jgi:two-component system response regulator YesN
VRPLLLAGSGQGALNRAVKTANEKRIGKFEHPAVRRVKEYVSAHLAEKITTERVAAAARLNKQYFCGLFKRETGMVFMDFVTLLRVQRAKHLLRESNLRIKEIACATGFQTTSHLDHVFTKREGMSPRRYQVNPGQ